MCIRDRPSIRLAVSHTASATPAAHGSPSGDAKADSKRDPKDEAKDDPKDEAKDDPKDEAKDDPKDDAGPEPAASEVWRATCAVELPDDAVPQLDTHRPVRVPRVRLVSAPIGALT